MLEASHSGLVHHLGKVAGSKGSREFKSLRLRREAEKEMERKFLVLLRRYVEIIHNF